MLTLSNGEFWIGTEQGLARYSSIDATSRIAGPTGVINELNGLPNPRVRDMIEFDGKVYVSTWGGGFAIYDIAAETWTSRGGAAAARSQMGDSDASPTENKIYFATNDGVVIYDVNTEGFSTFTNLTRDVVSAVAVRNSTGGVVRWYGPRVESIEDESQGPLPPAGITVSRGASSYTYTQENSGLPEPNVNAIFHDPTEGESVYWVATANSGVSRVDMDTSTWTTYGMVHGLPSNTVYSVTRANAPGGGTTIWVATQNGIARLQGNGSWQGYNTGGGLAYDRVRLAYSDDGHRLWIGYVGGGAARINPTSAE
jgi:ligand-binding sensor domain-containing protein